MAAPTLRNPSHFLTGGLGLSKGLGLIYIYMWIMKEENENYDIIIGYILGL